MAASSAIDSAPNRATMPPSIHTSAMPVRLPVSAAMPDGTRKMPLPIMMPTTTAMPVTRPSLRGSSRGVLVTDSFIGQSYPFAVALRRPAQSRSALRHEDVQVRPNAQPFAVSGVTRRRGTVRNP